MDHSNELARLEQFVAKLLDAYNELKDRQRRTEEALRDKERECETLNARIADLTDEKVEVKGRVSGLIQQIEQWESQQPPSENGAAENQGSPQGKLFGQGAGA